MKTCTHIVLWCEQVILVNFLSLFGTRRLILRAPQSHTTMRATPMNRKALLEYIFPRIQSDPRFIETYSALIGSSAALGSVLTLAFDATIFAVLA